MLSAFDLWRSGAVGLDVAAVSWGTRAAVLERQRRRLAALLAQAAARSTLYGERLRRQGRLRSRLDGIAPVTKAELMHRFDAWVTDPRLRLDDVLRFTTDPRRIGQSCAAGWVAWTSSGSSGEPGVFVQDAQAMAVYDALETLRRPSLRPLSRWLGGWWGGERLAFVGATGGHFASTVSLERMRRLVPAMSASLRGFSFLQPAEVLAAQLEDFAPTVLATYPTMALLLAEQRRGGRLAIAPREVWTGGETLSAGVRRRVERGFGCRVGNSYGASEFLAIAAECRCGRLHVNDDWVILEAVDADHRPVADGETGATTLLTNLANHLQPLIRYDLGDRIRRRREPCECGSPLSCVEVDGRDDDLLLLRDAHHRAVGLPPLALVTVLEDEAELFEFQLQQTGDNSLRLDVAAGGEQGRQVMARATTALRSYLARQGLPRIRLEAACGVPQRRGASGKLQRIVAAGHASGAASPAGDPRVARAAA